jgi:hypothetical protein
MAIPEARLATMADAAGILAAQNQTQVSLVTAFPDLLPWTLDQVRGLLENAAHPRGQFQFYVSDAITGESAIAGFMLVSRHREQPPTPDAPQLRVELIAARITGNVTKDRARLRRAAFGGGKLLARECFQNGLTWRGRVLKGAGFYMESIFMEMAAIGWFDLTTRTIESRDFWMVLSRLPAPDPATLAWPVS